MGAIMWHVEKAFEHLRVINACIDVFVVARQVG
jgi:hypothetical protein